MKRILNLARNPLISGSSIIFIGSLFANLMHYLFNLAMGRLLIPAEYGVVTSLVSLAVLFTIFQSSLTSAFAKFAARFHANGDTRSLSDLVKTGFNLSLIFASLILVIMLIFSGLLMQFLHISDIRIILLTDFYIFVAIASSLPTGIIQGEMRVFIYSAMVILNAVLKIAVGIALVILGFKVVGAMIGIVVSIVIPYAVSLYIIKKSLRPQSTHNIDEGHLLIKELREYSLVFFLATVGITAFSSVDIILARHYFNPTLAGQYAALAIMGKAIFYLTFPINFIFFPLIAQKREKKENVLEVLLLAGFIIMLFSVAASFVYFLFPTLVLNIFFPAAAYKILIPYLGPFSLYVLVFSLASLMNSFLLSSGKTQIYKINLICGTLMTCLIVFFHSTLFQVIGSLFVSSLLLLSLLLIYYWYNGRD